MRHSIHHLRRHVVFLGLLSMFAVLLGLSVGAAPSAAAKHTISGNGSPAHGIAADSEAVYAVPLLSIGEKYTNAPAGSLWFSEMIGEPTEFRYSWNTPPTDTEPWLRFPYNYEEPSGSTYSESVTIPMPEGGQESCVPVTLYTQVRNSSAVQQTPYAYTITLDRGIQAEAGVGALPTGTTAPGHSNNGEVVWKIEQTDEMPHCAGLTTAFLDIETNSVRHINRTDSLLHISAPLFAATDPEGSFTRSITLRDRLSNSRTYTATFVHDRTPPQLDTANAQLLVDVPNTAQAQHLLSLEGISYRDKGSPEPWGIAVAVATELVDPKSSNLRWTHFKINPDAVTIRPAGNPEDGFIIDRLDFDFNLTSAFGTAVPQGGYYYMVTLTDGAGNRGEVVVTRMVEIQPAAQFAIYLPLLNQ